MKKFLKNIIGFGIFALIGYSIIMFIWSSSIPFESFKKNMKYVRGGNGHLYTRLQELDTVSNIDILVLGSSHAYRGFDPRIFKSQGIEIFVLGSSQQTPFQTLALLKSYLQDFKPKLIIYEVYPGIFQNDGVESSLDIISNEPLNWNTVSMALKVNHLKTFNVLNYDIFVEALGLKKYYQEPLIKDDERYVRGGYVQKINVKSTIQQNHTVSNYELQKNQIDSFEKIVALIKDNDYPLLLVQAPITQNLYNSRLNNSEVDSLLSTQAQYVNFNDLMDLSNDFFYDSNHLNQNGVELFNKTLINWLRTNGL
ncbi:hypothetical protein [Roseivirga sp. E12]|uniref:hypothetical protein n=1 Tax=Roseivirga sp. E12 TaxID=2819237 RepID=UPI001ABD32F7|nr:hypothetical protein [Roseivirga sp. E12]MBO3698362.1 hypothetical protein [Roseivirga sp. E12]